ncbi:cell pole-organizing protein PopZ [Sinorhizobium kostiense]|uniref:Cell pole-organizing protein PopZ n=1 Tax=Sinorhizobium kostiense TaxID=76747 RepID=A0ABS4R564_9HYPH|nr:PopZ family protein [Sinorhizobium kostiense]MBP2238042.1 cell pole-organizing protein PopZ [Sinorhizobium kostiense]
MAQLNVAREPSMDEILASIRKIIESNETAPGASSARQSFDETTEDEIELTIDSEIETAGFPSSQEGIMSAERPSANAINASLSAPDAAAVPPSPLSLADVAARVRAASERHAASYAAREREEEIPMQDSPLVTSRMAAVASSAGAAPSVGSDAAPDATTPSSEPALPAAAEVPGQSAPPQAEIAKAAGEGEKEGGAIVSPAVGRQVARAFDDLAHAVEQGPRRSFDEIAEAMLRPMLQEWLDDNLPTLVEKLVREEIERVARGPRR